MKGDGVLIRTARSSPKPVNLAKIVSHSNSFSPHDEGSG